MSPVATPSEFESDISEIEYSSIDEKYEPFMEELLDESYEVSYDEYLVTDDVDTVSFTKFVKDIFLSLMSESESDPDADLDQEELILDEYPGEVIPFESDSEFVLLSDDHILLSSPQLRESPSVSYPDNVIIYNGSFNGSDTILYLPAEFYDDVSVINNKLYNVSNNTVYGRLHDLDLSDTTPSVYYLQSALGSPSSLYNYGSYNYSRDYYEQSSRLYYDTVYGDFTVTDIENYNSLDYSYKSHLDLLVIISLLGVLLLCYWRKSKR